MKNEIKLDTKLLEETVQKLKKIDPNQKLEFTITVFKRSPYMGLDRYASNTIRVRCQNVGRVKGEPRELEFFHLIWCFNGTVIKKNDMSSTKVPDTKTLNKLIENYSKFGTVTIRRNDLPFIKDENYLIIVDQVGNHLDFEYNIVESFNSYGEALRASRKYKNDLK